MKDISGKIENLKFLFDEIINDAGNSKTLEANQEFVDKVTKDFQIVYDDLKEKLSTSAQDTVIAASALAVDTEDGSSHNDKLSFIREDSGPDKAIVVIEKQANKLRGSCKLMMELLKTNKVLGQKKKELKNKKIADDVMRRIEDLTVKRKIYEDAGDALEAGKIKLEMEKLMNDSGGNDG